MRRILHPLGKLVVFDLTAGRFVPKFAQHPESDGTRVEEFSALRLDFEAVLVPEDVDEIRVDLIELIYAVVSIFAHGPDDTLDLTRRDDDFERPFELFRAALEHIAPVGDREDRPDFGRLFIDVRHRGIEGNVQIGGNVFLRGLMRRAVIDEGDKTRLRIDPEVDAVDLGLRDHPRLDLDLEIADAVAVTAVAHRIDLHAQPVEARIRAAQRSNGIAVVSRFGVVFRRKGEGDIRRLRLPFERGIDKDEKLRIADALSLALGKPIGKLGAVRNGDARVLIGLPVLVKEDNVVLERVGGEVDLNALTLVARDRRALLPAVVLGVFKHKEEIELRRSLCRDRDFDLAFVVGSAVGREPLRQGIHIHRHQRVVKASGRICAYMRHGIDRDVACVPVDIDGALTDMDGAVRREPLPVVRFRDIHPHIVDACLRLTAEEGIGILDLIAVSIAAFVVTRARLIVFHDGIAVARLERNGRGIAREGFRPAEIGIGVGIAVRPFGLPIGAAVLHRHARDPLVVRLADDDNKTPRNVVEVIRLHGIADRVFPRLGEIGDRSACDGERPGVFDVVRIQHETRRRHREGMAEERIACRIVVARSRFFAEVVMFARVSHADFLSGIVDHEVCLRNEKRLRLRECDGIVCVAARFPFQRVAARGSHSGKHDFFPVLVFDDERVDAAFRILVENDGVAVLRPCAADGFRRPEGTECRRERARAVGIACGRLRQLHRDGTGNDRHR